MIKSFHRAAFNGKSMTRNPRPMAILAKFYPWLLLLAIFWWTWQLSQVFWLVMAPPKPPTLSARPMQPMPMAQTNTSNALEIFAKPTAAPSQSAPPPDIKVVGVTVASDPRASFAMLSSNGKTLSYRVNDLIEGTEYHLIKVEAAAITIATAGGQSTQIAFGQPFALDQSDAVRASAATNTAPSATNPTGMMMPTPDAAIAPTQSIAPAIVSPDNNDKENPVSMPQEPTNNPAPSGEKNALGGAINGLQQNPAGYLSQMGIAATGQGYLVTDAMASGLKNRLGLQTGDRVIAVNGQNVGQNPSQDAQLLRQVQRMGQAQIQVQRGEQVVTVRQSF